MGDIKQCYWCGTIGDACNRVTISEDVPPRWLSGEKKVKEINCVPQCNICKKDLAVLDNAVNGYFKYGPGIDLNKIEKDNLWSNNKGFSARKIILNGNIDYAQSNGALLLWLRKLLVGLWYKEKNSRFDGGIFILAPWLSFDDQYFFMSQIVIPSNVSWSLLFDIDDFLGFDYETESLKKIEFKYSFISSQQINLPAPLQLLRFAIYGSFCGYCLFFPGLDINNIQMLKPFFDYPPLYLEKWLKGFPYFASSMVVKLTDSLKSISPEEAARRVRL
jgi:hypothetical protein